MPHREILNTGDTPYTLLAGQVECPAHKQVPVTDAQLERIDGMPAHCLLFDRGILRVLEVEDVEEIRKAEARVAKLREQKAARKRHEQALKDRDEKKHAAAKKEMKERQVKADKVKAGEEKAGAKEAGDKPADETVTDETKSSPK